MLYIHPSPSGPAYVARPIARLRADGWEFVDGRFNGVQVFSWPSLDVAVADLADGDFIVLRPPANVGTICTDVIQLTGNESAGDWELEMKWWRAGDGTAPTWDVSNNQEAPDAEDYFERTFDEEKTLVLLSKPDGLVFAQVDETSGVVEGAWWGYLQTAVLGSSSATPQLHSGLDPHPLATLNLLTLEGEVFAADGSVEDAEMVNSYETASGDNILDAAIPWPGAVPSQVVTRSLLVQDGSPPFLRGALPHLFPTSATEIFVLVRADAGQEAVHAMVIHPNLAIGAI